MDKIKSANKGFSPKNDGFLFVMTEKGFSLKRKYREFTHGRFAGKVTFNVWDNVYSFKSSEEWTNSKSIIIAQEQISLEGKYEDIYGGKRKSEKEVDDTDDFFKDDEEEEEVKEEEIPIPEVLPNGEVRHEKYGMIKACIENNIPVYLVGPAGSGKNHTLEQVAWELELDFYFTNSIQQEYKLTGFIDAGGVYHETEFYKAFTKGGLFFLDEMDASIPEVLVLLNAAIANGYFEFPTGKVNCNEKFRVVSAGNTVGNGADEQYTGRLMLDQATLDRFAIIEFNYSLVIEMAISKGNSELVSFVRQLRDEAKRKGIRATFSYRCITMVSKLENMMKLEDVMLIAVMKGFDKDTINTFNPVGHSKYHNALEALKRAV